MSFTGMLFLFCFLPLALGIYYVADRRVREYVLLGISLCFYAFGSMKYILLFICAITVSIVIGRSIGSSDNKIVRRILLAAGIALNAGILIYYKYSDMIFAADKGRNAANDILLPLGISFFTFKAISYLADVYTGKAVLSDHPVHDAVYLSFFAQVQSGPLTRYNDMCFPEEAAGLKNPGMALFSDGVIRFMTGFSKKVLVADMLANITAEVFSTPLENYTMSYAWLGSVCYSLQLFFDFAGYSDMAVGMSEMFGYKCMENFNYPYITESVSGFWRRWHISLSEWFRDYIYIPLGGSRNKHRWRTYLNLLAVWLLTGIWHGAAWNYVIWGLGYFVLISFERLTKLPKRCSRPFKWIYRVFVLFFINCEWILFRSQTPEYGFGFIGKLFTPQENALTNFRALFLMKEYRVVIIAAVLLSTPVIPWIRKKLSCRKSLQITFDCLIYAAVAGLFICSLSFIVAGQNNPFAYANF